MEATLDILFVMFMLIAIVSIWDSVWKAISLWKSARNGHLVWFICLLVFNTVGILPIIYTFLFSEKLKEDSSKKIEDKKENSPKKKMVLKKKR